MSTDELKYEMFKERIAALCKSIGVKCRFARYGGNYYAWASTGERFKGNSIADSIEVQWASGHTAYMPA